MDGSTGIWMGLTLAAPLTLVPEIALLRLMHSRRAAWHPLDVLLVALLVGQLCCTLVTLGLSAAALARNAGLLPGLGSDGSPRILEGESASGRPLVALELLHHHRTPLCAALISFWAAAHTLHAATLTSMAVDRAMTIRWSYKYRVSVRRTQIRYHVVVLAVVSLLVGVATLFASGIGTSSSSAVAVSSFIRPAPIQPAVLTPSAASNDSAIIAEAAVMAMELENCSFLPYTFDSRFSLFWLCLHGVLFLTTLTAGAVIFVTRVMIRCSRGFSGRLGLAGGSGSDMRTLGNASDGSSATLPLPTSSSSSLPTLPAPPPPRYTPGPVACLSAGSLGGHHQHAGTAKVSPTPQLMTRSSHPNFMFGSTDKTFMNLLHHHESGLAGNHHKTGTADFSAAAVAATGGSGGCCGGGSWNRQRHSTVAAVLIVAYFTHHLPLLVLTTLGTFFADILPSAWPFSALVLGLSLFSGLLFMAVLVFIDPVLYAWMVDSLRPGSRRIGADRHRHLNHHHHHHHRSPVTSESATLEPNLIAPMKIDDDTRYRMSQIYSQEPTEAKFPLTNGSLFVHLMNPSSGDGKRGNRRPSRMGVSAYDHRPAQQQQQQQRGSAIMGSQSHIAEAVYPEATKPPLMTFMSRARILSMTSTIDSFQSQCANVDTLPTSSRHHHQSQSQLQSIEPFYNDPMSSIGAPPSFADAEEQVADVLLAPVHHAAHHVTASSTSLHSKFKSHEPIYASLSETLSSSHTLESVEGPAGSLLDEFAPNLLRQREIDDDDDEEDEGSATESAGDDFEFHNIRTSRQTLITPPNDVASASASTEVVFGLEDLRPRSRVARSATYRILCNGLDVKCAGKHDTMAVADDTREVLAATSESRHGIVTCVTIQIGPKEQQQTAFGESSSSLRRSKLLTSLSMNDIDVLGESQEDDLSSGLMDYSDGKFDGCCVRSDSLFSLYMDGSDPLQSSPESSLTSPFKENQSLICSAIELSSNQTTKNESSPVRRSPFRQQQQQHQQPMVNLRKKSSHRSRAAVLKRFQEREMSWPSQGNGIQPLKTGSVVSIAALKAALTQSPTSHYLDNGELYFPQRLQQQQQQHKQQQQQQQSKTVFVSDYI